MRQISDIYAAKRESPVISLEFFPPKTTEGDRVLFEKTLPQLKQAGPDYCSVTYGAGGSTRDKTLTMVERIQRDHGLTTLAHLTCVDHTQEQVENLLDRIQGLGCQNILALRGDPPDGGEFKPTVGGLEYAAQLVELIRRRQGFSVGVAGFPEGHIACKAGPSADWANLKRKVDAGADFIITQLFFDNTDFFRFRDHLGAIGVRVPIVPGVVSILSSNQIRRFTQLCGARIPGAMGVKLEEFAHDDEAASRFGIEYATRQCQELLAAGVPGFHFYTLNKAHSTLEILRNLRLMKV